MFRLHIYSQRNVSYDYNRPPHAFLFYLDRFSDKITMPTYSVLVGLRKPLIHSVCGDTKYLQSNIGWRELNILNTLAIFYELIVSNLQPLSQRVV